MAQGRRPRVDLYSAGALAVHVLSGQSASVLAVDPRDVLRSACGGTPQPLAVVLERMLSTDASLQPRSVEEVRDQLAHLGIDGFRGPQPMNRLGRQCAIVPRASVVDRVRSAFTRARTRAGGVLVVVGPRGSGKTSVKALVKTEALAGGWDFEETTARLAGRDALAAAPCDDRRVGSDQAEAHPVTHETPSQGPHRAASGNRVCFVDDIDLLGEQDLASVIDLSRAREERGRTLLVATCREIPLVLLRGLGVSPLLDETCSWAPDGRDLIPDVCRLDGLTREETSQLIAEACARERVRNSSHGSTARRAGILFSRGNSQRMWLARADCTSPSQVSRWMPPAQWNICQGPVVLCCTSGSPSCQKTSAPWQAWCSWVPGVTAAAISHVIDASMQNTQSLLADLTARGILPSHGRHR